MRFANLAGRSSLLVDDRVHDLNEISKGAIPTDPTVALRNHWGEILELHRNGISDRGEQLDLRKLGPPVPEPRAVFAVGLNYRKHAEESGMGVPRVPAVFTKFPTSITGPFSEIVLPPGNVDYEAELAFVVGRGGKNISRENALDSLAGYMASQDISERKLQFEAGMQFSMGKSFDTFCPTGPAVVTLDELDDPLELRIACRVNGRIMQEESTADMVFSVPELVEFLSSIVELRPGDICLTGTPAGVGSGRNPKVFLKSGDVVETEIDGVGTMRNPCVARTDTARESF